MIINILNYAGFKPFYTSICRNVCTAKIIKKFGHTVNLVKNGMSNGVFVIIKS